MNSATPTVTGDGSTSGAAMYKAAVIGGETSAGRVLAGQPGDDVFFAAAEALSALTGQTFASDIEAAIEIVKFANQQ